MSLSCRLANGLLAFTLDGVSRLLSIDFSGDGTPSNDELCSDLVVSSTRLTCNIPDTTADGDIQPGEYRIGAVIDGQVLLSDLKFTYTRQQSNY